MNQLDINNKVRKAFSMMDNPEKVLVIVDSENVKDENNIQIVETYYNIDKDQVFIHIS